MLNVIRFTAIVAILVIAYGAYAKGAQAVNLAHTTQAQQIATIEGVQ